MPILYHPSILKNENANLNALATLSDTIPGTEELSASLEMFPRNCTVADPPLLSSIKPVNVKGEFIAFASPDSTYAVTRKLMDNASSEIIIGIYDFTAGYVQDILLQAMQRGVEVTLMLDVDNDAEKKVMKELAKFGATTAEAPSCANSQHIRFYPCCHEKVIIIDQTWCIVQSGNYSKHSIPFNEKDGGDKNHFVKGNRDMGVAIKSPQLCKFFTKVIKKDMELEAPEEAGIAAADVFPPLPALLEKALSHQKRSLLLRYLALTIIWTLFPACSQKQRNPSS
jgi:phosphatidylserine/phosphatidylglycerophosphate/cardiolipin synthase-like enzyme